MAILLNSIIPAPPMASRLFNNRHLFLLSVVGKNNNQYNSCSTTTNSNHTNTPSNKRPKSLHGQDAYPKSWPSMKPDTFYYYHLPPICWWEAAGTQGPKETPDAEDGDDEGPDESHFPLFQGYTIPLQACGVHKLLYELQQHQDGGRDVLELGQSNNYGSQTISHFPPDKIFTVYIGACLQLKLLLCWEKIVIWSYYIIVIETWV